MTTQKQIKNPERINIHTNLDFPRFTVDISPQRKFNSTTVWLSLDAKVEFDIVDYTHKNATFQFKGNTLTIEYNPKYTMINDIRIERIKSMLNELPKTTSDLLDVVL